MAVQLIQNKQQKKKMYYIKMLCVSSEFGNVNLFSMRITYMCMCVHACVRAYVKAGETREERNERLLNGLRLRGNNSFKRFRDLMFRTGNFFIADLLWEEGPCCSHL